MWVSPDREALSLLPKDVSANSLLELMLAEVDKSKLDNLIWQHELNQRLCEEKKELLSVVQFGTSEFVKIKDQKNNILVLYTSNGMTFVPSCVTVTTIEIISLGACYKDLPVYIPELNVSAFLLPSNIITNSSQVVSCNGIQINHYITQLKAIIVHNGTHFSIKPTDKKIELHELLNSQRFFISHHTLLISNSISEDSTVESEDPVGNVSNIDNIVETDIKIIKDIKHKADVIEEKASRVFKNFSYLVMSITIAVLIFLVFLLVIWICICKCNIFNWKRIFRHDKNTKSPKVKIETVKLQEFKTDNGITFIVEQEE